MILVDSNILLDILTVDDKWYGWSSDKLSSLSQFHELIINDFIYTEVSIGFERIEDLEAVLLGRFFRIMPVPKEALFLAGKVFLQYKTNSGNKNFVLPDFFIGTHANILDIPLLTRDTGRYKTYFPKLQLITP
ncbi:type II toxin-antitoxin system VapC family toxin [Candidatus Tisiphia endosymbiont of Hybos culiciformis]|uniref:type II toxin-antitoxin system VapC family toxin n=1 Tax=Candidatus Tisiphia endosymbiont of Hybos culiciformis TaxID=3139331 RepID=UPI003CCA9001